MDANIAYTHQGIEKKVRSILGNAKDAQTADRGLNLMLSDLNQGVTFVDPPIVRFENGMRTAKFTLTFGVGDAELMIDVTIHEAPAPLV